MGNAPSSRRSGRIQQPASEHPPPRPGSILARLNPAAAVSAGRQRLYPSNQMPSNGLYLTTVPQGLRSILTSPSASAAPHIPPFAGHQTANTIRNDVNLKKATLRLEKDETNPGHHLVAFSFDANLPGSICICFLAKEGASCSLTPVKTDAFRPVQENFDKGLGQIFRQKAGTGVNLSLFDEDDLSKEGEHEVYALVVRTETVPRDLPPDPPSRSNEPIGAPLPQWINCQTTHAVIEYKEGEYNVRVVKQIIWVHGIRYELQEIYGIENSSNNGGFDGNDSGKECVICMSEPRDTTVLPCRHMCMCSECAKVLRFQTNRCPICRCSVERLLEIRAPKNQM